MKYVVDRIENEIVILESLETQLKKEILLSELPEEIKEGNILIYENELYTIDLEEEQKRRQTIKNKFNTYKSTLDDELLLCYHNIIQKNVYLRDWGIKNG